MSEPKKSKWQSRLDSRARDVLNAPIRSFHQRTIASSENTTGKPRADVVLRVAQITSTFSATVWKRLFIDFWNCDELEHGFYILLGIESCHCTEHHAYPTFAHFRGIRFTDEHLNCGHVYMFLRFSLFRSGRSIANITGGRTALFSVKKRNGRCALAGDVVLLSFRLVPLGKDVE
jgi:hypothetical protein